jgi:hypothetical protein
MLKKQALISFKGGLDVNLIDTHFISNIQSLRIDELFIACDNQASIPSMQNAVQRLQKAGFNRHKIYCYALIGDDMEENENRCREIYRAGAMPRAQLFREYKDTKTKYNRNWEKFGSMWQRPASTVAHMEQGTNYWEFKK